MRTARAGDAGASGSALRRVGSRAEPLHRCGQVRSLIVRCLTGRTGAGGYGAAGGQLPGRPTPVLMSGRIGAPRNRANPRTPTASHPSGRGAVPAVAAGQRRRRSPPPADADTRSPCGLGRGACSSAAASPEGPPSPDAACARLAARSDILGRPWAEVQRSVVAPEGGRLRILRPGMMATMDFDSRRLNIHLDQEERVVRLACG